MSPVSVVKNDFLKDSLRNGKLGGLHFGHPGILGDNDVCSDKYL